jgi:hypothetical protein
VIKLLIVDDHGGWGLVSTAADYLALASVLFTGGTYHGG